MKIINRITSILVSKKLLSSNLNINTIHITTNTSRPCHSFHQTTATYDHLISFPDIMDAKEGIIDKWLKKEGDSVKSGERLCEVTLDGLTIGVDAPTDGYLAEILIRAEKTIQVKTPIAVFVETNEEFLEHRDSLRVASNEHVLQDAVNEVLKEQTSRPDTKILLREIKHLIQQGYIDEKSEFAKKLQSLARKGDIDLLATFEASYDGIGFDMESFDKKFFVENATDLVNEKSSNNIT